ncbi:MAG: NAD-dependent epimerase/dehydratase family protein [Halioglobus sp.]|nr:NAD-dependent epimerase/dehydratase family protein [Halioglobus sp.]
MKCLVSGATGFIGRKLCQQLEAQGHVVIALSRHGGVLSSGKPTLALDLTVHDPSGDLLSEVDVFFHLAGIAHQQSPAPAYEALNYRATERLARLASAAGVGCFIFLSSVKAMGPSKALHRRSESESTVPSDPYGLSKWHAECALQKIFSGDDMSIVILRPALVYGHDVKGNLQAFARGIRWGLPRPPERGARSMIAVEDLVALLCVIAQRPPVGVRLWIACGSHSYSTRVIYDLIRAASGKGTGTDWLPHWAWSLGARMLDMASGQQSGSSYEKLFGTELYNNTAVIGDTDWAPRVMLEHVIEDIIALRGTIS